MDRMVGKIIDYTTKNTDLLLSRGAVDWTVARKGVLRILRDLVREWPFYESEIKREFEPGFSRTTISGAPPSTRRWSMTRSPCPACAAICASFPTIARPPCASTATAASTTPKSSMSRCRASACAPMSTPARQPHRRRIDAGHRRAQFCRRRRRRLPRTAAAQENLPLHPPVTRRPCAPSAAHSGRPSP